MISTFGPQAERIRAALPADLDAIAFDEAGLGLAYVDAVARRERGERFYMLPLFDNLRVSVYNAVGAMINGHTDPDERYGACRQLGAGELEVAGGPVRALVAKDNRPWQSVYELLTLGDELLVRSYFEYTVQYAMQMTGIPVRRILLAPSAPEITVLRADKPSAVVWTGRRPAADAIIALMGLEEFRGDVAYVADVPLPNVRARFISRTDAIVAEELGRAACIVCIDPADPADAVAFARRGASVVAPVTSGAVEFAEGISSWDAGNGANVYSAVAIAMGRSGKGEATGTLPVRPPAPALPRRDELPLVTILTATYNRRAFLQKMLTCVAVQTYPRIESVVVNDAGESVDDIVAAFPFARVVNLEQNRGTLGAAEAGLAAARGEYIGLLPDDDWIYPDHIERLMYAILRSGAALAHSHSLIRFLERLPDGTERTAGFNGIAYAGTVTPTAALIATAVPGHTCLQRRDTFDPADVGWYQTDSIVADQEYHMRLIERHQLVRVPSFTCEFRDHAGNTGKNHDWAEASRLMYEGHPVPGRPVIEAIRVRTLEGLRSAVPGANVNEPTVRLV